MKLHYQYCRGFTLVEALVALAVFSVLSVVIGGVFINASDLQRRTATLQRLQNDGRYMIEKLAREIRARELDYPISGDNPQSQLSFKPDELQQVLLVRFDATSNTLLYNIAGAEAALNSADVRVIDATFYVAPTTEDVWSQTPQSNIQPRVTIRLTLEARQPASGNRRVEPLTIQTTISSKVYHR